MQSDSVLQDYTVLERYRTVSMHTAAWWEILQCKIGLLGFTKHKCSKLSDSAAGSERSVCVNTGFRWHHESWHCDFRAGCKAEVQELLPTNGSGDLSKWGNVRLFPLEFELLLRTCALLSCGPFTAAAMKTFILQQVKCCPLNSFYASAIFSFTGPKAAGWCLIIYSLHPLSVNSIRNDNVRRKVVLIS